MRRRYHPSLLRIVFCGLVASVLTAMEPQPLPQVPHPVDQRGGQLHIAASSTMANLLMLMGEALQQQRPGLDLLITAQGSATVVPALLTGEAELGAMNRELHPTELEQWLAVFDRPPLCVPIANELLQVRVHADNPLAERGLSLAELDAIFSSERLRGHPEAMTHWGQFGLTGEWSQRPITPYIANSASTAYAFFKHMVLDGGNLTSNVRERVGGGTTFAVEHDPAGIDYGWFHLHPTPRLRVVPLSAGAGPGNAQAPMDRRGGINPRYPLRREFVLVLPDRPLSSAAWSFLTLALGEQGQEAVQRDAILPLSPAQMGQQRKLLGLDPKPLPEEQAVGDMALPLYHSDQSLAGSLKLFTDHESGNLATLIAEQLLHHHPRVQLEIEGPGGSIPLAALMHRGIDAVALSRPFSDRELAAYATRFQHPPVAIAVAQNHLAIIVHPDNPLVERGLDMAMVEAIFSATPQRGQVAVSRWGDLGLQGAWAEAAINRHGPSDHRVFQRRILQGGSFHPDINQHRGRSLVPQAVAADPFAIGYVSASYLIEGVRSLPLAAAPGAALHHGTADTKHPLSEHPLYQPLFMYVRHSSDREYSPLLHEYLRLALSRQGQAAVAHDGLMPLTPAQAETGRLQLLELMSATE